MTTLDPAHRTHTPLTASLPAGWHRFTCIDAHTGGEPLRVITSGFPEPPGKTMLEKRAFLLEHCDHLRRALMHEPRGHADMYGCLPTAPVSEDGDLGVLFMHNEGYSTMCGHGIIAIVKVGLDCGLFSPRHGLDSIRIDTPAGRVTARAECSEGQVRRVLFRNVPSFALELGRLVDVPQLGSVSVDIGFGGAFYAYVDGAALGLVPDEPRPLIDAGMRIKRAVAASCKIVHPSGDPDLNFLYGTIFTWASRAGTGADEVHSRNVCIFAEGEVDRSPTGTGVSGRAAILHAKGELALGRSITIESIVKSRFSVSAVEALQIGAVVAIVPEVGGTAHVTGRHEFLVDPADPFAHGFFLR
ncbi:MAG TPA: proline racemase family protein [Polyangiaceae bacterium]|jgi:trans-L-3-hydroxyproline dehydratase|nr:proline racemase family protein [Polyangiaceae bacterium]